MTCVMCNPWKRTFTLVPLVPLLCFHLLIISCWWFVIFHPLTFSSSCFLNVSIIHNNYISCHIFNLMQIPTLGTFVLILHVFRTIFHVMKTLFTHDTNLKQYNTISMGSMLNFLASNLSFMEIFFQSIQKGYNLLTRHLPNNFKLHSYLVFLDDSKLNDHGGLKCHFMNMS